ncbi:hypothetical protein [Halobacillus salinus]|uniref:hypothetical protein n=1 Tax=Halobacillus salinus TaxID=192814 RepID=UPI0015923B7C|nr:hypothetical protein [Halobacillus salinus]
MNDPINRSRYQQRNSYKIKVIENAIILLLQVFEAETDRYICTVRVKRIVFYLASDIIVPPHYKRGIEHSVRK